MPDAKRQDDRKPSGRSKKTESSATKARWMDEMDRPKSRSTEAGNLIGFGSWYRRQPGKYSPHELTAGQGHEHRVRTVDLLPEDRLERENQDDDSMLMSDWKDRTSIDPEVHRAHKDYEREMKERRSVDEKRKRKY